MAEIRTDPRARRRRWARSRGREHQLGIRPYAPGETLHEMVEVDTERAHDEQPGNLWTHSIE